MHPSGWIRALAAPVAARRHSGGLAKWLRQRFAKPCTPKGYRGFDSHTLRQPRIPTCISITYMVPESVPRSLVQRLYDVSAFNGTKNELKPLGVRSNIARRRSIGFEKSCGAASVAIRSGKFRPAPLQGRQTS